jgi:hypothetical protein
MPRPRLHLLSLSAVSLVVACTTPQPDQIVKEYPRLTLSQGTLDFGTVEADDTVTRTVVISNQGGETLGDEVGVDGQGMPMGVGVVALYEGSSDDFVVSYDATTIECPEGSVVDTGSSKGIDVDTGGGGETGEGGGGEDTGASGGDESGATEALFVLNPGCKISVTAAFTPSKVGDQWAALEVTSVQAQLTAEQEENNDIADYMRDPIHWDQMVYLHGDSEQGQGTLVVSPRSYDFGYVYPGSTDDELAQIEVSNVGDGEVTLTTASLDTTCDEAYSIVTNFEDGKVLAGGESTLVEVQFAPTDEEAAYCTLNVGHADDTDAEDGETLVDVTLKGNAGSDPENEPPTVAIRSPEDGYEFNSVYPLELELNVFDVNQPPSSLTCKVKSRLMEASIAECTPTDDSGHVYVSINREDLDSGIDTLTVTVTDASETTATASVSVLVNTAAADDDDDGDGYGATSDPVDCDDGDQNTYPDAAEIYDLADNDCDGTTDEGTEGSDDDGDGVSEVDGDCNDYNNQVYPGAPERGDGADNDCDGTVDEGTSLYDDDGDGFAEVNNDCNDDDSTINPGATELCDGVDNDCDGLKDQSDGCVETDSSPTAIGNIKPEQNACLQGEVLSISALFFDADEDVLTYTWGTDAPNGLEAFDNPYAPTVNFTCPDPQNDAGRNYNVYVLAQDPDGGQDWSSDRIAVYPSDYTALYEPYAKNVLTTQQ